MKKVGGLFTCSALALMAFAALPLSAAELTHRWSFNGDWSDSAGGADAAKCGTYVSLYGGRVHMGYGDCTHGTGYVDLGTNMLDTTAATIEIWARERVGHRSATLAQHDMIMKRKHVWSLSAIAVFLLVAGRRLNGKATVTFKDN